MFPDLARRMLLALLVLAALTGWGLHLFKGDPTERNSAQAVELEQQLQSLQSQYDELQSDHDSLIMERTALLTLNENLQQSASLTTNGEVQNGLPGGNIARFPYTPNEYLRTRLNQARKQLRYHRSQKELSAAALSEAQRDNDVLMQRLQSELSAKANEHEMQLTEQANQHAVVRDNYEQTIELLEEQLGQAEAQAALLSDVRTAVTQLEQQLDATNLDHQLVVRENERLATRVAEQSERHNEARTLYEQAIEALADKLEQAVAVISATDATGGQQMAVSNGSSTTTSEESTAAESIPAATVATDQSSSVQQQPQETMSESANARVVQDCPQDRSIQVQQQLSQLQEMLKVAQVRAALPESMAGDDEDSNNQVLDQLLSLQQQLNQSQIMLETVQSDAVLLESEFSSVALANCQDPDRLQSLEQQLSQLHDKLKTAQSEAEIANLESARAGSLQSKDRQRIVELQQQLSELQEMLRVAQANAVPESSDTRAAEVSVDNDQDSSMRLQQQLSDLQAMLEESEEQGIPLKLAQDRITVLDQQLQQEQQENRSLQQALSELSDQVDVLKLESASAQERTQNMETMTQAINEENRRFGELINQLQDNLGLTIAEKNTQISAIQSAYTVIEYSTDILFESGSAELSATGRQVLKNFSATLDQEEFVDRIVSIEGHTDNVPIKGSLADLYPTNWELSFARAASATRLIIEQGIAEDRIRAVGYGSSRPVATNDTDEGRAANRRIEVHLVPELNIVRN